MDHDRIRAMREELKAGCDQSRMNEENCLALFRTFKALVVAHAKAEEFILYALVEQPTGPAAADLQHFAFEGYEEHDLIDFLMKEMGQAEEITMQWKAQLTVLSEMIDHHLIGEEQDFFPKVRDFLNEVELADLGVAYTNERDVIFAKRADRARLYPWRSPLLRRD
ncbi:MAG: hemerythrin domain-containing protein [Bdellovibrionaceae bacterium]|nr:hemerythrin domain-containing protein [Pseudobdellovibrionaceae bacterium]